MEFIRPVRDAVEDERIGLDVVFQNQLLVYGGVADLVARDALVVPGCFPRDDRAGRLPLAADELDLVGSLCVECAERVCVGNVAAYGRTVVACHHQIEGIVSAVHFVGHSELEYPRRFGDFKFNKLRSRVIGRISVHTEDRDSRIFQRRQVAERIADGRAPRIFAHLHGGDDRCRHCIAGERVGSEVRVCIAVGIERPDAGVGIVDGDGDAGVVGKTVHDLHVFVLASRDCRLRVLHAAVRQRR